MSDTLPEAETAGVVEGRPRRGPKPVTHFVSFDPLMAKSKLDKDMLNKRYLGKEVRAPPRMKFGGATWDKLEQCHNLFKAPLSATVDQEYNLVQALYIAKVIMEIRNGVSEHGVSFYQNYIYQKGIKMFGEKGRKAAGKELDQLHQRNCYTPIDVNDLTPEEKAIVGPFLSGYCQ